MSESGATEQEPDPTSERLTRRGGAGEPDVLLDIPEVTVDQIRLAVDGLDADLSLRARLANLLQIDAGVRVHLQGAELDVTGVSAEALFKVRLEKLVAILDRALSTIDRNPQVIDALARTAALSIDDVNRAAQQLVGGAAEPVVNQTGQQLGTVGAIADRTLREQVAEPGPTPPAPSAGPRPPEPPTGPGAQAQQPRRPGAEPTAAEPTAGGTGAPAKRGPVAPGGPSKAGPGGPSEGAETAGKPGPTAGGAGQEAGGTRPGPPSGGGQPGQAPAGQGRGRAEGMPGAAQSAGETLRQAGRSVWEAIQGGMGQGRQQRPKR